MYIFIFIFKTVAAFKVIVNQTKRVECTLYAASGNRLFIVNHPNSKRCSAVSSDLFSCKEKVLHFR